MANKELSPHYLEVNKPQEACGITAVFSKKGENVSLMIPSLQNKLQHRGKDSSGMAAWVDGDINIYARQGKVTEVFPQDFDFVRNGLISDRAIGHNRYGTSGGDNKDAARGNQPVIGEYKGRRVALAYNGNLPDDMRWKLKSRIPEELQDTVFDTEEIASAIVSAKGKTWEERIYNGMNGVELAYSLTILTDDGRVFGLRGPSGTWPLWYGETDDEIIFASETRVYRDKGIKWKEVKPGELVEATSSGVSKKEIFKATNPLFRCALHDAYGAGPKSLMTENSTYADFREELGRELAREYPLDVDLIVGIPHTGLVMAKGYAEQLNRTPTALITINGENGDRSFIAPNVEETSEIVSRKYRILNSKEALGKRVLLIDDSLIRGKTMAGDPKKGFKGVIDLVRNTGAKEVHLAVVLPKFVNDCDMGYYIRKKQLVSMVEVNNDEYYERSEQEIAKIIGANSVSFLSIDGVERAYLKILGNENVACMACMGEKHPLRILEEQMLKTRGKV